MLKVTFIPALRDNYIWLVHGASDPSRVAVVDPGESQPLLAHLRDEGLQPAAVLVTHHHPDHTGGAAEVAATFDIPICGPALEARGLVTEPLEDGATLDLAELGLAFEVLHIPGHTLGHIALFGHGALFCGDTLFSAGCGRLFEGTAEQMAASLERLAALPDGTRIYCGHEYTAANLAFAAAVEPDNTDTRNYRDAVNELRVRNMPTLPSHVGLERLVNPFLRTSETRVRRAAEQWSASALDDKVRVFAALRRWKDNF